MPPKRKPKRNYQKRKNYKKNNYRKRRRTTGYELISRPLLPQTQKVGMRYTTRVKLNPPAIKSGNLEAANNLQLYTLAWNNLNDIDQMSVQQVHHTMDGARNHQPIMYDQFKQFYDKNTVIGARARITFSAQDRMVMTPIYGPVSSANPVHVAQGFGDITGYQEKVCDPIPCYVGFLNAQYADDKQPAVKLDEVMEKREARYRMLVDQNKPAVFNTKWSINKEPTRRNNLELESGLYPGSGWGALFEQDVIHTQMRHLHLFAHPVSTKEVAGFTDPGEIDVSVEMDFIVVLSDRKEIAQSA